MLSQCRSGARRIFCKLPTLPPVKAKCDDIYQVMSFKQLTNLFQHHQLQRQRLSQLREEGTIDNSNLKDNIERYVQLIKRNE